MSFVSGWTPEPTKNEERIRLRRARIARLLEEKVITRIEGKDGLRQYWKEEFGTPVPSARILSSDLKMIGAVLVPQPHSNAMRYRTAHILSDTAILEEIKARAHVDVFSIKHLRRRDQVRLYTNHGASGAMHDLLKQAMIHELLPGGIEWVLHDGDDLVVMQLDTEQRCLNWINVFREAI